ncbi:MAG: hypothetical protein Q4G03_05270 [Planctomycetia bacterium]|nr:hypothetical protein [Planctomycetia bacterium]
MKGMNRSWNSRLSWTFATLTLIVIVATLSPVVAFARAVDDSERSEVEQRSDEAFRRALKKQDAPWYEWREDQTRYLPSPTVVESKYMERERKTYKRSSSKPRKSKSRFASGDYNALIINGLKVFLGIVLAAALIFCAIMTYRIWKNKQLTKETLRRLELQRQRQFQTLTPEAQVEFDDLLGATLRMTAQRDWRKAIIYYFSWLIVESDAAALLVLDKGKTNLEYWQELHSRPKLAEIYLRVMNEFERVYFGDEEMTEEQFVAVAKYIDDVIEILLPLEEERQKELTSAALEAVEQVKPSKREFDPEESQRIQRLLGTSLWERILSARNMLHSFLFPLLIGLLSVSLLSCGCSWGRTPTWKARYGGKASYSTTSQTKSINGLGAYRDYLKKERRCKVDIVYLRHEDELRSLKKYDAIFWMETSQRPLAWNAPCLAPLDQRVDAALRCMQAYSDVHDGSQNWNRWILPAVNVDLGYLFWQNNPEKLGDYHEEGEQSSPLDFLSQWMNERKGRAFYWILSEYDARQDYLGQSINELSQIAKDRQTYADTQDSEFIDNCLDDAVDLLQIESNLEQNWEQKVISCVSEVRFEARQLQKLWRLAPSKLTLLPEWGVTEDSLRAYQRAHDEEDVESSDSDAQLEESDEIIFDEDEIVFDDDDAAFVEIDNSDSVDAQEWLENKLNSRNVIEQEAIKMGFIPWGYRSRIFLQTTADLGDFWASGSVERERFKALVPRVRFIPRSERLDQTQLRFSGREDWTRRLTHVAPLREYMRFYPSDSDSVLLKLGDYPLVARRDYQQGRLFFLNSSSFLCNYGLTDSSNRAIAARIAEEIPYKSRVAIVLTNGAINAYPNRNDFGLNPLQDQRKHGEFSLTRLSAYTVFFWHGVALSAAMVLSLWPIYGRARRSAREKVNDLGLHVNAVARILARTDARQWCWETINQFMRQYRGVDLAFDKEYSGDLPSECDAESDTTESTDD